METGYHRKALWKKINSNVHLPAQGNTITGGP